MVTDSVRNSVTLVTTPLLAAAFACWPSLPRSSSWSLSPPPNASPDAGATQQPGDPGPTALAWVLRGEPGQADEDALGRGTLARHGDVPSGVPGGHGRVVEVGDAVGDASGVLTLAERRVAVGTERVRLRPGARGVDDRAGQQPLVAGRGLDVDGERVALATGVDQQVTAGAAHADHPGAVADRTAGDGVEKVGQRPQVGLAPLRDRSGRCSRPVRSSRLLPPGGAARPGR